MPNASAPNAPCVEVWLSPQTIVMPGCVSPSSGPDHVHDPLAAAAGRDTAARRTPRSSRRSASSCALRERVGDRPVERRDVVIHRRDRQVGPAHRAARQPQRLERLRARHLVHEVQVDVEQRRLARPLVDDVRVPDLVEERRSLISDLSSRRSEPKSRSSRVRARSSRERRPHRRVEDVAVEHDVEAVAPRRVRERARDELHEVHAVARERPERAVERARLVVGDERERRAPALAARRRCVYGASATKRVNAPGGRRRRRRSPAARSASAASRARDRGLRRIARLGDLARRVGGRRRRDAAARPARASSSRHWSNAAGCERSVVAPRASRPASADAGSGGSAASPRARSRAARRRAGRASRRSGRCSELSIGSTPSATSAARRRLDDRDEARQVDRRRRRARARAAAAPLWLPAGPGIADGRRSSLEPSTASHAQRACRAPRARVAELASVVARLPPERRGVGVAIDERAPSTARRRRARARGRGSAERVLEQQRERAQHRGRVRGAGAGDVGRRAVHRLEDARAAVAEARRGREAEPAGDARRRRRRGCRRTCSRSRARRSAPGRVTICIAKLSTSAWRSSTSG